MYNYPYLPSALHSPGPAIKDISSTESSPNTSTVSSRSINSEPQQKEPSKVIEIADSSDDDNEGPIVKAKHFRKRLVWSDDEDDQNVQPTVKT